MEETQGPLTIDQKAQAKFESDLETYKVSAIANLLNSKAQVQKELENLDKDIEKVKTLVSVPCGGCVGRTNGY